MKHPLALTFLVLVSLVLLGAPAWAGYDPDPIGYVQTTQGDIIAINSNNKVKRWNHQEECRALGQRDPVFLEDTIVTGYDAKIQIMFLDGSILVLGPESDMVLNELVYDYEDDDANLINLEAGAGVFRYVSGGIVRRNTEAFELDTPLGMIGIRGTEILSIHQCANNPNGPIVQELADIFRDPEDMAIEEKRAARQVLDQTLPQLGTGRDAVTQEILGHIRGVERAPVIYTFDATGKKVEVMINEMLTTDRDRGSSDPAPIADEVLSQGAGSRPARDVEVPGPLRGTQGASDRSSESSGG
ncbi:MAG: hypothetical protein D6E12_02690 [Desulfovibrio sp.]|nr:MAG: hypothetical protein D6E12_02690 [Desulfovibrio sp.]